MLYIDKHDLDKCVCTDSKSLKSYFNVSLK